MVLLGRLTLSSAIRFIGSWQIASHFVLRVRGAAASAATSHRAAPNNGRLSETSSSPPATLIPGKNFGRSRSGLWPAQVRVVGERAQLNDRHRHTETFDPSDHHLSLTQHGPGRRTRRPHSSRNAPSPPHSSRNDLDVGEARSSAGRLSRARGRAWVVAWWRGARVPVPAQLLASSSYCPARVCHHRALITGAELPIGIIRAGSRLVRHRGQAAVAPSW